MIVEEGSESAESGAMLFSFEVGTSSTDGVEETSCSGFTMQGSALTGVHNEAESSETTPVGVIGSGLMEFSVRLSSSTARKESISVSSPLASRCGAISSTSMESIPFTFSVMVTDGWFSPLVIMALATVTDRALVVPVEGEMVLLGIEEEDVDDEIGPLALLSEMDEMGGAIVAGNVVGVEGGYCRAAAPLNSVIMIEETEHPDWDNG